MVVVEPKHLAAWKRADPVTQPGRVEVAPTYSATLRPSRRRKTCEVLAEGEPPKLDGLDAE